MHGATDRLEFAPPRAKGSPRAFALALLVHILLIAALTWGVNWKRSDEAASFEAELWASTPQQAAPRLAEVSPPTPLPTPAPVPTPAPPPRPPHRLRRPSRQPRSRRRLTSTLPWNRRKNASCSSNSSRQKLKKPRSCLRSAKPSCRPKKKKN